MNENKVYGCINKEVKVGRKKPMSFGKALPWNILKGMMITFKLKKKVTINYPEQTRPFSPVFRGLQVLNRDEEGRERCTACGLCAVAVLPRLLPWKQPKGNQVKRICTAKKSTQHAMR
jgi:formate hydrogenlyase subunit 6/NADH:ubiquinone oxidoreductase subunit I